MDNNKLQLFISLSLGDGSVDGNSINTNSVHREYLEFKAALAGIETDKIVTTVNSGYKKAHIHSLRIPANDVFRDLRKVEIEKLLYLLDDLGLAMWFYDDGSLHKKELFYNLNTHAFTEQFQRDVFIPYFNSIGLYPKIFFDKKADGRKFAYLYFNKSSGASAISLVLEKYPLKCFDYKRWDLEYALAHNELRIKNPTASSLKIYKILKRTIGDRRPAQGTYSPTVLL